MPLEGILSVGIPVGVFAAVASNRVSVEATMFPEMLLLILIGAVEPALAGFAHPAVISIAALFVFAAGMRETGVTQAAAPTQLGRRGSIVAAQFRLMAPGALLSAFINNTPVVAMCLPLVRGWAERIGVSPSKLLMPLSYASMLGGQFTLIGGASNLIVMGLYIEYLREAGLPALMFPVAMATARELGVHPGPFEFSLILACGLSLLSPLAYQTNLMVSGLGGYRFLAFPKVGAPLTLILAVLCALICPLAFPFRSGP
ncbi:MAG: SLC13 family permease [Bryobacterales bacterium]|nr:SLC13 family permease [Bryobacterales bacterium]